MCSKLNKNKIIVILLVVTMFLSIGMVSAQEGCYISITINEENILDYEYIDFFLNSTENLYGDYSNFVEEYNSEIPSDYILNTYDINNNLLNQYSLYTGLFIYYDTFDPDNPGGILELNESVTSLIIPYDANINSIKIDNQGVETDLGINPADFICEMTCISEQERGYYEADSCCEGLSPVPIYQGDRFICVNCGDGNCTDYEDEASCYADCAQDFDCLPGYEKTEFGCVIRNCLDFDDGVDLFVSSYVSNETASKYDVCVDDNTVREYYCGWYIGWDFWNLRKIIKSTDRNCEFGCSEGRCLGGGLSFPERCDEIFGDNMVSYWRAENNADDSYSNNHGTIMNNMGFDSGKIGQGFSFDGVDDYVVVPEDNALDLDSTYSIFQWVYPTENKLHAVISKGDGAVAQFSYRININSDKTLAVIISKDGRILAETSKYYWTTTNLINWNEWQHVGFTFNSGVLKLYINGEEATNVYKYFDNSFTNTHNSANDLFIGMYEHYSIPYTQDAFKGKIDEVAIFDRVLSSYEIDQMYNEGLINKGYCEEVIQDAGIPICVDYDEDTINNGIYVKSRVDIDGNSYEDYCFEENNLLENVCIGNVNNFTRYNCRDYNSICEEGKCVELPPEPEEL